MITLQDLLTAGYTQQEAKERLIFLEFYNYDEEKQEWRMKTDGQNNISTKSE
jgi:hypothetical protein